MVRKVVAALVTAATVAIALGGVARVLMRLVTVAAGHVPGFSWSGTAGILAVFFVAAVPGCLVAAFARRRRWVVLAVGSALLCIPATGVASEELGDTSTLSTPQWVGVGAASLALYATVLALPVVALAILDRLRAEGAGRRQRTTKLALGAPEH